MDEEAVVICRELTRVESDRYRPTLASTLSNLGVSLRRVGRRREALAAGEEAVVIYRELTKAESNRYCSMFARTLDYLGTCYVEEVDIEKSLETRREAVAMWRTSAEDDPQKYGASYKDALRALRQQLSQMGRDQEAITLGLDNDDSYTHHDGST